MLDQFTLILCCRSYMSAVAPYSDQLVLLWVIQYYIANGALFFGQYIYFSVSDVWAA